MAGFFALRRRTYESAQNLTPLGYKIALELMCKCRVKSIVEIPIHFGTRLKGQSKLSLKQQFRYLEHLSRLYDFKYTRASPVTKFLIATSASWIVAFASVNGLETTLEMWLLIALTRRLIVDGPRRFQALRLAGER